MTEYHFTPLDLQAEMTDRLMKTKLLETFLCFSGETTDGDVSWVGGA